MGMNLASKIELVPTDTLKAYERNARTHSPAQIEKIAASIKEFGFANPILIDKDQGIIAGHGRLEAAKKLKLEKVPVVVLDYLTPAQKRAYILADNRLALDAGWDPDLLQKELEELSDLEFDLSAIGFSDEELEAILEADDPEDVIAVGPTPTLRSQLEEAAAVSVERREESGSATEDESEEDIYSKKIEAPIYEPKGEKPPVAELFDDEKTRKLVDEINRSIIPDDVKEFLQRAATRHTVFDYGRIAEFYAHAAPEVQALFEKSALVIIDFDKAIENGFVQMTKDLAEGHPNEAAE